MFIKGKPGVGKSSIVYQAAAAIHNGATAASAVGGFPQVPWFIAFPSMDRDPSDVGGLYGMNATGKWVRQPSDLWEGMVANPDGGVLCIEELPQATSLMQCALRELLL